MLTCANTMQMNATGPRGLVRRQHGDELLALADCRRSGAGGLRSLGGDSHPETQSCGITAQFSDSDPNNNNSFALDPAAEPQRPMGAPNGPDCHETSSQL